LVFALSPLLFGLAVGERRGFPLCFIKFVVELLQGLLPFAEPRALLASAPLGEGLQRFLNFIFEFLEFDDAGQLLLGSGGLEGRCFVGLLSGG
jgi:hypothetical protein